MKFSTKLLCGIRWDFYTSQGYEISPLSWVVFSSSCSLDPNYISYDVQSKKWSKYKEGTKFNECVQVIIHIIIHNQIPVSSNSFHIFIGMVLLLALVF